MKKMIINLIALFGISLLGMGISNAAPSADCGDDDVQPITIQGAVKAVSKET